jgi:hypothetical protein
LAFFGSVPGKAPGCRILLPVTVEKPTREKRRRPAATKTEERVGRSVQPVAPVDADERRRARERAGGDD